MLYNRTLTGAVAVVSEPDPDPLKLIVPHLYLLSNADAIAVKIQVIKCNVGFTVLCE